jgi:hypothetical protein
MAYSNFFLSNLIAGNRNRRRKAVRTKKFADMAEVFPAKAFRKPLMV